MSFDPVLELMMIIEVDFAPQNNLNLGLPLVENPSFGNRMWRDDIFDPHFFYRDQRGGY
jgi:hypothetical protein